MYQELIYIVDVIDLYYVILFNFRTNIKVASVYGSGILSNCKTLRGLKMAFHVPAQTRAIDPYSSYNSDNVNSLTRIVSNGLDIISSGLDVDISNSTTVIVHDGVAIKDDSMIHITETNIIIDLNDPDWFVEETAMIEYNAKYYVVLDYIFEKIKPIPTATIRILKTRSGFTDRYMFLKCIEIVNGTLGTLYDYDPDNELICRRGAAWVDNTSNSSKKVLSFTSTAAVTIDGVETFDCVHNFDAGTEPIIVQVYSTVTNEQILPSLIKIRNSNTIRIGFDINPGNISVVLI